VPQVLENIIVAAAPDASDYTVALTWANGAQTRSNFARLAGKGVFVPLSDPDTFKKVRVGDSGRSLVWPGDIDFCADALWFEAHPEDAPSPQRSAERAA
jgi:hypothetical protein